MIVGGGIAGCSTLYHLAQEGLTDAILLERDELTSGSTWHAAAQVTQFGSNQTMVALKRHSIELYRKLAADPDHPINYHITGGMRLAHRPEQVDCYRHFISMAAGIGVQMEYITPSEVGQRHPLITTSGLLGAWWDPLDGDIDPAQLCFSLARKARIAGAEVQRFNPVEAISRHKNGEFTVHARQGDIKCEILVNASGYRANEVGRMLGVTHPVVSLEHMYFLTEPIAQIEALEKRVPIIRDPGDDFYSRQEKHGLLVGVYEQACKPFGMNGIDPGFSRALCESDLDRCLDNMERIFRRLPCLSEAGIHTVVNGPITYTPDGAPLVGPIPGIPNAFACLGLRAGIGEGGGLGKILAELIVYGESEWDAWYLDPRRFSSYANAEYTCQKAMEDYQNEFHYVLPHEYRPAGRPARTTPLYPVLDRLDCQWGVVAGWERALYFKPGSKFADMHGFRFTSVKQVVGNEVKRLAEGAGLMEVSGFNRYEISGPGAKDFLDAMICGNMPDQIGKVRLCYLLSETGNVLAEATIAWISETAFWYCSAAAAELHDKDWLCRFKPQDVKLSALTETHTALVIAGPQSRPLLSSLTPRSNVSAGAFPWMAVRRLLLGHVEVMAMSVSFSGELAYELHVPNAQLYPVWKLLADAGKQFGLIHFGLHAAESMRIEKGYLAWKKDLMQEYNPIESGLKRFVNLDKPDFVGKQGLLRQLQQKPKRTLVSISVDCQHACAHPGTSVYCGERLIGTVTSGEYGHRTGINYALAFVDPATSEIGQDVELEILGDRFSGAIIKPCQYDAANQRVRAQSDG